ncbi:MAG: ABC transporter substrate-binding protein [Actinobacteria bacterium]|nr:ABC transporter substrate-binding protein [Actinomycetota bacterium]
MRPTTLRALAVLASVALATGACRRDGPDAVPSATPSPSTATTQPELPPGATELGGGSLRFALGADPAAIDPRFVADAEGRVVVDAVFDSLVRLGPDLRPRPAAALSWESNEDATEFTFSLDPGATFHDGSPVTAGDFVRAFDRIASGTATPPSFLAHRLEAVAGFEEAQTTGVGLAGLSAPDPTTLVIRLRYPYAEFPEVLADPSLAPVPAVAEADPVGFGERPIGNGPFQLAEPWQHDQFIRVARARPAAEGGPRLDEIVFPIYSADPAGEEQFADLEEGQLHVSEVPVSRTARAVEEFGLSDDGYRGPGLVDGLTTTVYYYGFNTEVPPFDDPDVRRAVAALIDRDRIVDTVTRGIRVVAEGVVPPSIPGAQEEPCPSCGYDPDRARELLGDRELEPIRILHNRGRTHQGIAEAIAREMRAVGLEVEVSALDLQPYVQTLRAGEMGMFRLGWEADHPSPGAYLHPLFGSEHVAGDNVTRFTDPEVDALLAAARAEPDEDARNELYQEVERRVLETAVVVPVFSYAHNRVVAPEVRDLVYDPFGTVDLSRVWLDETS